MKPHVLIIEDDPSIADLQKDYLEISKHRREELDNSHIVYEYRSKIKDIKLMNSQCPYVVNDDIDVSYRDLPF